ncbi:response regulator transcription factor [Ignavibacteria bacterium]|nr:response regulator transcription factor [Bacteroidota bacterium]MCZ2132097.1 response regulator transcription factor [Bacteroidota bacterium]
MLDASYDDEISVVIADDHEIMRLGLRRILSSVPSITIVGEAANGEDAIAQTKSAVPSVVLLDINMPRMSGIDAARAIKRLMNNVKVVILSAHEDYFHLSKALSAGADGYLSKEVSADELIGALYAVMQDERVFSRSILELINRNHYSSSIRSPEPIALTRREQEILELIAIGFTSAQIAEQMNISIRTVETHRYNLINKLGVKNTADLIRFSIAGASVNPMAS